MSTMPSRSLHLCYEQAGDELLLVEADAVHRLSPTLGEVWRACDGASSVAEVARELGIGEPAVRDALSDLLAIHAILPVDGRTTVSAVPRRDTPRIITTVTIPAVEVPRPRRWRKTPELVAS